MGHARNARKDRSQKSHVRRLGLVEDRKSDTRKSDARKDRSQESHVRRLGLVEDRKNEPKLCSHAVKQMALRAGFDLVGIAKPEAIASTRLDSWLGNGFGAGMTWMEASRDARLNPRRLLPTARSIIVLAVNYFHPGSNELAGGGRISRYAWGRDYHRVLGARLRSLRRLLEGELPSIRSFHGVDAIPMMEKVWAQRAGLGWIGKSGNLVTRRYGSWVFLATMMVDEEVEPDEPHPDHCGSCERCIEACPTGAIVSPGVVDSRRCVSYNTIENKEKCPDGVAERSDRWLFGCDACQDACPWSRRFARFSREPDFAPRKELMSISTSEIAALDEIAFDGLTRGSPLRRAGLERLRHNARLALRLARGKDGGGP